MLGNRKVSRGLSVPLDCLGHDGFAEPSGAPGRLTMQDIGRFDRFFSAASAPWPGTPTDPGRLLAVQVHDTANQTGGYPSRGMPGAD